MTGKRSGSSSRLEPTRGAAKKNRRNARDEEEESEQGDGNPMVSSVQDCSDDEEGSDYDQEDSQGGRPNRRGEEVRVRERGAARRNQDGNDEEASQEGSRVDNNDEISTNSTTRTNTPPPTRLPGRNNGANIVTVHRNGSTRQQKAPHLLQDFQLDEQNMHNWKLSIKEKVRNEIFYMKQFAKEGSEYGSTFQRLLCNKATVPVEVQARYWDSRGRKIARSALNEKRKTIIGSMKREFLSKFDRDTIICDSLMNTDKTQQLVLVLLYSALQKQLRTERKNICYTTLSY